MNMPSFFDEVPPLVLRDPLAQVLGAARDGLMTYAYADVVKLAGHSCPTVAGAFLTTCKALRLLYPGAVPVRGDVAVDVREAQASGVAGVVGAIASFLTGAAGEGGFKGLGGRYGRNGLLRFGADIAGELRFTRVDTGDWVELTYRTDPVPRPEALGQLLAGALAPDAGESVRTAFADAWQEWVRRILIDSREQPALVSLVGSGRATTAPA